MFPTLGLDLMNGLKLAFKNSGTEEMNPNFIVEGIGNAAGPNLIKVAEKMILQDGVTMVLGFCGSHQLEELVTIFKNYKKPLIRIDLGGSVLREVEISPYVVHQTLGLWQSAYETGRYGARTFGKKVSVIASIYDGGYQISECFAQGLKSDDGEVASYYVGPMDYKSEDFSGMVREIEEVQPNFIYALFSYKEGTKIFKALANSKINGKIPILATPVMTDETINTEDLNIKNVQSIATWSFEAEDPAMQTFVAQYKSEYDNKPNVIGLLGYETGLAICSCITSEGNIDRKIGETLQEKTIESPRGTIRYNAMFESQADSFKLREFQFDQGRYLNNVVDSLDASYSEKLYEAFKDIPNGAWQNPYICT
jgi:branched-chain amino acid transport system substrate-binding protein